MKCGTSTLASQLSAQPGIFITTPKEPNFFSDDDIFRRGMEWYESLFSTANPSDLKGDASTHYTKLPTLPHTVPRVLDAGIQPRIIYMVRDPIDRLVSHFIHNWTMGQDGYSIDTALDRQPELIDYSRYGYQLKPWVQAFGQESLLLITLEEMTEAPQPTLERICEFLGFDGPVAWDMNVAKQNESASRIRQFPFHKIIFESKPATIFRRYAIPRALRDRVKASRQMRVRPTLSRQSIDRLVGIFQADYLELSDLLPVSQSVKNIYEQLADRN